MKLEDQVVSLELAKQLKELGVKQESLFYWWKGVHKQDKFFLINPILDNRTPQSYQEGYPKAQMTAAFTVAELGKMLPEWLSIDGTDVWISCSTADRDIEYTVRYGYIDKGAFLIKAGSIAYTEADARAKMLIYLLENNLTTLK